MIPAGTPEWTEARIGKATASRIADVVAKTKTGWGASRANYMAELIAERLTGTQAASYTNAAMQWGVDHEADAVAAYEFRTDATAEPGGFVDHPTIVMSGASPDRFVGADGLLECKCPNTATHIDTLLRGFIPEKYVTQMMWQMACTGRRWCDFVSFDPRMPESMRLYVRRIERNDTLIENLQRDVVEFLAETEQKVSELNKLYGLKAAA